MLRHIVMWKLKEFALGHSKSENALLLKEKLLALRPLIPEIKQMEVGINLPTSEYANYDAVLDLIFDDYEALVRYQAHPDHKKLAGWIGMVREERGSVDYLLPQQQ